MKPWVAAPFFKDANVSVRADQLALAAVLIIALFVRFYSITVPVIWYDEAYSLLLARETPARIWALTELDVHPPLYYVLLHYWGMAWGDSAGAARGLSVLADVGSVLLGIQLMRLVATRRATWMAALLLALLPVSVRYSQEVRMYTLLGFWLMAATVALVCWARTPGQKRWPCLYVLLMSAAFYTHYFAAGCVLVHWLFWWRARADHAASLSPRAWCLANAAIVLLFVPWLPNLLEQLSAGVAAWIEPVTVQAALGLPWQFMLMEPRVAPASWWRLAPLLLIVLCAVLIVAQGTGERRYRPLLLGYFFVPTISLFVLALFMPLFLTRYLVFAAPGIPLLIAVALDSLARRYPRPAMALFVLVVVGQCYGLAMVYRQTDGMNGTEMRRDYRLDGLASQIEREAQPGDDIVLDSLISYLPFLYYNTSAIEPRFHVRTAFPAFLASSVRGGYALIPLARRWIYFHDPALVQCRQHRVWWIPLESPDHFRTLFSGDWQTRQTLWSGSAAAYLFSVNTASVATGGLKPRPPPAARNCQPGPSATSASRTRH
ncbi:MULTISPECIES: glycosyltransferase family 39 protein [Pseudomonas]|uniref:glycosyltransferase family 39 protein n=1 Tax=Pseudomonas TaxID=286 RepID=UPI0039E0AC85